MADRATASTVERILGAFFTLLVAAAAGAAGWVGYDHYLGDEATATASDGATTDGTTPTSDAADGVEDGDRAANGGDATATSQRDGAPWPAELVMPADDWPSFRFSLQPQDDVIRQVVDFDAVTNRAKITLLDPEGAVSADLEVLGFDVWLDQGDGWEQPSGFMQDFMTGVAYGVPQQTLADLLPPAAWPYTTLIADESSTEPDIVGGRRLVFVVDNAAFSRAQPIAAAEWRRAAGTGTAFEPTVNWTFELDAEGHIRLFSPGDWLIIRYGELTAPPVFTSPLAG